MTRYWANSAATRKNRPLTTGYDNETAARDQAVFLATTYGGVAKVVSNEGDYGTHIASYSVKRGWF